MPIDSEKLVSQLYGAIDLLRATNEHHEAVVTVLGLLFWKRLSDVAESTHESPRHAADDRFSVVFPAEAQWPTLLHRQPTGIAEAFRSAQLALERANPRMPPVFSQGDLFAAVRPERLGGREQVLFELLQRFHLVRLSDEDLGTPSTLAQIFNAVLHREATGDERLGSSLTPPTIARLIAALVDPQINDTIYDPVCGSAGLLAACITQTRSTSGIQHGEVFGRERVSRMWAMACINLYFNRARASVRLGDSLRDPPLGRAPSHPDRYDLVVANPPFSLTIEAYTELPFPHFPPDVPLRNADYAFIQHALASTNQHGRVALLMPHGVLFRSGAEQQIRRHLIEKDYFEAVIGLAPQLFYGTNIAVCVLILNRAKPLARRNKILFVDASRKFSRDRLIRQLPDDAIETIVERYRHFDSQFGFSRVVSDAELENNDFDLSIARYVRAEDTLETTSLALELNRLNSLLIRRDDAERKMLDALRECPRSRSE